MPTHALLKTPMHEMNAVELREFVNTLRTARTSSQTFAKHLKADAQAVPKRAKTAKADKPTRSFSDMMKELEANDENA